MGAGNQSCVKFTGVSSPPVSTQHVVFKNQF
jgi:hypothetical protein